MRLRRLGCMLFGHRWHMPDGWLIICTRCARTPISLVANPW